MQVGYFYWGYLGDKKYNNKGEEVSTPDGNAFYSWSILQQIQQNGDMSVRCAPDRDAIGYTKFGQQLFESFAKTKRTLTYRNSLTHFPTLNGEKLDYAIIEWRWIIEGRNDKKTKRDNPDKWQPDYEEMVKFITYCNKENIPFVVFDLDYKLTEDDIEKFKIKYIIELGNKWQSNPLVKSMRVEIPFDFSEINENPIRMSDFDSDVVYIGNRYERDWCIEKYLPNKTVVHGNWLENGRTSDKDFPNLIFRKRLNNSEIFEPYNKSVSTVLLAKKEYCDMGFMTARIIESVFYSTVPFVIAEFSKEIRNKYFGKWTTFLTVRDKEDVSLKAKFLKENPKIRQDIILYLRKHLQFMDCKFFIRDIEELLRIKRI